MFPNICHKKLMVSSVTTLPKRAQEWLLWEQPPQNTGTAHSHVQLSQREAAPGTPDGAPMQKGRVGKVDAWTGHPGRVQKYCLSTCRENERQAPVELKSMRWEGQREGIIGKRKTKENTSLLLNEMQLSVKEHRKDWETQDLISLSLYWQGLLSHLPGPCV